MAIDYVRGGSPRFGSLLIGSFAVILLFLICNWWSLTSKNFKLLTVINDLEEQIKISGVLLDKCLVAKTSLEDDVQLLKNGVAESRVKLEQLRTEEDDTKDTLAKAQNALLESRKRISQLETSLKLKSTELESLNTLDEARNKTLEAMRTEKKALGSKLQEAEAKIEALKKEPSSKKISDPVVAALLRSKTASNQEDNMAVGGNHAEQAVLDENGAEEMKNEAPQEPVLDNVPVVDQREAEMNEGNA